MDVLLMQNLHKFTASILIFTSLFFMAENSYATVDCCCIKPIKKAKKKKKNTDKKEEEKKKSNTPAWPVTGLYMSKDDKSLCPILITPCCWLNDVKYRGWLDGYLIHNFNAPTTEIVNRFNYLSVIKGRDITIEGRVFDVHSDQPTLGLAEIELEKLPDRCVLGAKLDLAIGDTQDILADTIAGSFGFDSPAAKNVKDLRYIQHASIGYIFPIGTGLRVDFGKFVTHMGGEYIEPVKNWNYSHSFYNTYGVPAQETGLHFQYNWNETFHTEFYLVNGWNCAFVDNNNGKTWGPTLGLHLSDKVSFVLNYLQGPEQNNNSSNIRRMIDGILNFGPFDDRLWIMFNLGYGCDENAVNNNTQDAHWSGIAGYVRYKINDEYEPAFRIEYYTDPEGFTTNVPQHMTEYTFTYNILLPAGCNKSTLVLIRPEIRYDHTSANFYSYKG